MTVVTRGKTNIKEMARKNTIMEARKSSVFNVETTIMCPSVRVCRRKEKSDNWVTGFRGRRTTVFAQEFEFKQGSTKNQPGSEFQFFK